MTYQFERHFTLDEANALIPEVRATFQAAIALAEAAQKLVDAGPVVRRVASRSGNGHKAAEPSVPSDPKRQVGLANALVARLVEQGIVVQDWQRGLIDFPSLRDGREVFLCYELADGDRIRFYHEIDAGYAGREPV